MQEEINNKPEWATHYIINEIDNTAWFSTGEQEYTDCEGFVFYARKIILINISCCHQGLIDKGYTLSSGLTALDISLGTFRRMEKESHLNHGDLKVWIDELENKNV